MNNTTNRFSRKLNQLRAGVLACLLAVLSANGTSNASEEGDDSTMNMATNPFRTPEGEAAYLKAYDRSMKLWPVPYASRFVDTRWGQTHVIESGSETAPPMVLLHGMGASSTMWYANVESLARRYRVYAVDTIGTQGKSVSQKTLDNAQDFVDWLDDVLDGLALSGRASVVGHSHGGWMAINYAIGSPDRVESLVVLAPAAALRPLVKQFYVRAALASMIRSKWLIMSFLNWSRGKGSSARDVNEDFIQQTVLGMQNYQSQLRVLPTVFSDDELRRISAPTLVMIGDHEVIYDPERALERADTLIPDVETVLIPDAGHGLFREQAAMVNQRILAFLDENAKISMESE